MIILFALALFSAFTWAFKLVLDWRNGAYPLEKRR